MRYRRDIFATVKELACYRPALLITGPRQTGKSTMLQMALPGYRYVSLDLPHVAQEAEENGVEFLRRYPPPVIIDEVQYAPNLFRYLKDAIDQDRSVNGRYVLTGSQVFPLFGETTESLAGRISILNLHSMSLHELSQGAVAPPSRQQILEWMFTGGYPELHASALEAERFYSDYVATYLERDVRQIHEVRNLRDFNRFLRLMAIRTGQMIQLNSVASDLGVATNTVKTWLSVLETSGIIRFLEPYYRNLGKRMVKTPKLYFLDTGLACFLAGLKSPEALRDSPTLGAMFETLAFGQIVRSYAHRGYMAELYYYRDHAGHEVDFVTPVAEQLELFEVKWAETVPDQIAGFKEMDKLIGPENVISRTVITPDAGPPRTFPGRGFTVRSCIDPRGDYVPYEAKLLAAERGGGPRPA
jgi:uncharacterized protein